MMAKDSVKNRIAGEGSEGMSFTGARVVLGYVFCICSSTTSAPSRWVVATSGGNITYGNRTHPPHRQWGRLRPYLSVDYQKRRQQVNKSEGGNILVGCRTHLSKFYQYWMNTSDGDAERIH